MSLGFAVKSWVGPLPSVRDLALGKAGILKKTLKIFAESQADKALGKDYTLPSANPRTLGKGIFFKKKLFYFLFLFLNHFFFKFVPIHFENTLSNSLNNANLMLQ